MTHLRAAIVAVVLLLPLTSHAFDGKRKGFVLGGGGGLSPYIHWSRNFDNLSETKLGPNLQVVIGYAWDNTNLLVYQAPPSFAKSDKLDQNIFQGVWAVRWYHYFGGRRDSFGTPTSSWYGSVGVGPANFNAGRNLFTRVRAVGWGLVVGVGYEFKPHLQAGLALMAGWGSDEGYDYNHQTLALTVTALAY